MFQISIFKKTATYLSAFLLFSHATAVFCEDRFYVIWRDIGLPDAVRLVSQYSGKKIRLAQEVQGTISLASTDPLSADEVFTLFQKSLQERGLLLVRGDDNAYQVSAARSETAKRRYVGAVFAFEQRAQAIVSRLRAADGEAEVLASDDPAEQGFSVVLLYRDSTEGYQAMISAVERAGLNNLIATPTLSDAFPVEFTAKSNSH
jgi:type II secretory pathway component GspD/PulD (secretin)